MSKIPVFPNKFAIFASILGVIPKGDPNNPVSDLDIITDPFMIGSYYGSYGNGVFVNLSYNPANIVQILFVLSLTGASQQLIKIKVRGWHNDHGWDSWKEVSLT